MGDRPEASAQEVMVDAELTRTWREAFSFKAGVQNTFDDYPDPGEFGVCCGGIYRSDSVTLWQGALLYLQASWSSG